MMTRLVTLFSAAIISIAGIFALWAGTSGFDAFTTETARRLEVLDNPKAITDTLVENQYGKQYVFRGNDRELIVADFIYTRCPTICRIMGSEFGQIQEVVRDRGLSDSVSLLSISFDTENDTPEAIQGYLARYRGDGRIWQGVRVPDRSQEQVLLDEFGVTVLEADDGQFIHNAAFYVIQNGQIVRIFDYDDSEGLLGYVHNTIGVQN